MKEICRHRREIRKPVLLESRPQRVEDFMNRKVAAIRADAEVHELEKLLLAEGIHGVPVVDDEGLLVGVISQTDLLAWHFQTGVDGTFYDMPREYRARGLCISNVRTARIDQIMSPIVHSIGPTEPAAVAALRMIEHRVHRLIVTDDERHVLGVLSSMDLLCALPGVEAALGDPASNS